MNKLELKSSHEVIYTVNVADVESIFYCKPTDPDILTVLMKDGKRLYCDEVCPVDSLQEEPVSEDLEKTINDYFKDWKFDEELDIMVKPNNYSATFDDIKELAKHFFELGMQVSNKLQKREVINEICEWIGKQKELLEDSFSDPNDFADILKQEMMKDEN